RHWNPWVWRILHLLFVAGALVLTWWLNQKLQLKDLLTKVPERYQQLFLPVLFLLVWALSWLGYWLWRLLGEEEAAADFPDVDAGKTIQCGEQMGMAPELVDEMRTLLGEREKRDLTPDEAARLRELAELTKGPPAGSAQRRVRLSADEQARGTARLRFLCRL